MTRLARAALPLATLAALTLATAGAQAVSLVGLTSANELAMIDTANIAGSTTTAITGLATGDRLVGIDVRPKDGKIYGVSLQNKIYTLDGMTGLATQAGMLDMPVVNAMLGYGIDFNPSADFANGSSLRLVSSAGSNFAINADTGVVGNASSNIGMGYTGVAYTNSVPMPTMAPAGTALYYVDSNTDMLMMAPSAFNSPTITAVGSLGVDVLKANGFDIGADGMGYAAFNVDAGPSLTTGIYGINLATGGATLLGTYNGTLSGLTVSAVPEPQTVAMMLAGLVAVGALARRRRAS
jgi:hypothetical protein